MSEDYDPSKDFLALKPEDPDYLLKCEWSDEKAIWVWRFYSAAIDEVEDARGHIIHSRIVYSYVAEGDREWAKRMANHYKISMPEPSERHLL